ncbi:transposase [Methylobacterium terrae]|uniref:transposase n=1 Tax=Methylobacterium terrae TaxID=2202827 RepID=UPI0013A56F30|nr:transposase [Methylobacterium terrae]
MESDLGPFGEAVKVQVTIPGIGDLTAQVILSEIGPDMSRFPTAGHLISWAGLCPGSDESAGKRRSTRLRKGTPWLKTALVQAAWAGTRRKTSDIRAQFRRLGGRRPRRRRTARALDLRFLRSSRDHLARAGIVWPRSRREAHP